MPEDFAASSAANNIEISFVNGQGNLTRWDESL
jgi:hypothetical protein